MFLLFGLAGISRANPDDSTGKYSPSIHIIYITPIYCTNQLVNTFATFGGVGLGYTYRERADFYAGYYKNIDQFQQQLIFPTIHKYSQQSFGASAQYFIGKHRIKPLAGAGIMFSRLEWQASSDTDEDYSDNVVLFRFHAGGIWKINKTFALQVHGGYIISQGVEMVGLKSADIDGFFVEALFKIRLIDR
mgnify:CR=1 FL=1